MIFILICVSVYIISTFTLRAMIIHRFRARLTTIDLMFILIPIVNTCIIVGRGIWILLHILKKLFTKFGIWFINKNRMDVNHD